MYRSPGMTASFGTPQVRTSGQADIATKAATHQANSPGPLATERERALGYKSGSTPKNEGWGTRKDGRRLEAGATKSKSRSLDFVSARKLLIAMTFARDA